MEVSTGVPVIKRRPVVSLGQRRATTVAVQHVLPLLARGA